MALFNKRQKRLIKDLLKEGIDINSISYNLKCLNQKLPYSELDKYAYDDWLDYKKLKYYIKQLKRIKKMPVRKIKSFIKVNIKAISTEPKYFGLSEYLADFDLMNKKNNG